MSVPSPVGLPLEGLRVVDSTDQRGELGPRLLADLGAQVVKIEPPGGAPARRIGPRHEDHSLFWAVRNLNEDSVTVDLTAPDGEEGLRRLLSEADIWIDGGWAGVERLRRSAGELGQLVVVAVSDFGLDGPYRDYLGTDAVMVALSGMLFRAGVADLPPVVPPGQMAYDVAGIVAAWAALAGYWQRERTGRGELIDLSVMEACAQTTDWGLTSYSFISRFGVYGETRDGGGPIYNVYPCKDGHVRASVVTPREWHRIREWLGDPEFLMDPHWDVNAARIEARDVLEGMYKELFSTMTKTEVSAEGQRRGLGITPVLSPSDVLKVEHFAQRGAFVRTDVINGVNGPVANGLVSFTGRRAGVRAAAPTTPGPVLTARGDLPWTERTRRPAVPAVLAGPDPSGYPFRGLRVLDFGVAGAAPEVARLLAEYGADSIRVESRLRPDLFRVIMGSEMSPVFASSNRSKRSFGVDFRNADGIELIKGLIRHSDVLVENLPPGTMDAMGLGWDEVHATNPALVMLSSQLMGAGGPWESWRGYGANTQPAGGLTHLWSFPDMPPVGANVAFPDHVVGRLGTAAVLAALLDRERTGEGCHVEIAQVEVVLNLLSDLYLQEALEPGSVGPRGNESERGFPWGPFQCAGEQRWCVITCRDDGDWERLVAAMGSPAWAMDPALAIVDGRRQARDKVERGVTEWTAPREDRDVMATLQRSGVPAGIMTYISDMPKDPQLKARGYARELDQPGLGPVLFEGPAFHGSALPDVDLFPAPHLGQHTREICSDLLGLDGAAVDGLVAAGALFEALE